MRTLLLTALLSLLCTTESVAQVDTDDLLRRADKAADARDAKTAVALLTKAIAADPTLHMAYYKRGRAQFMLADAKASVADFDRFLKLAPRYASRQWERGISLYYAGKFEAGAKQFALYQEYHDNDVENSVWRYICMARTVGVAKARAALMPIRNDRRVPMMPIYAMFRGEKKPADVLKTAMAGAEGKTLRRQLFYAHLYIGLFHEAAGDAKRAAEHIGIAAGKHMIGHYMGDVARVHLALRKKR